MKDLVLAITAGEPAGIGADICLDLNEDELPCRVVILADINLMKSRSKQLGLPFTLPQYDLHNPQKLSICHISLAKEVKAGQLDTANAAYVLQLLNRAYTGIVNGEFDGMVTAPLHKGVINDANLSLPEMFSGHTEYLARLSNTKQVVMMLAGGGLKVALATTHLPLKNVPKVITPELLESVIKITINDLQNVFGIPNPKLLICGLNPHAGESGHLGDEENKIIIPVLQKLRNQGVLALGPFPADTIFQPFILQQGDAVLGMYHDQVLPVLKYASFGGGVNITLGLPFVRTSVDHGTALDLAGSGKADSGSLKVAIQTAYEMCCVRRNNVKK
ncbi:MAG: 4-hydroxythreonine-4-phosphate dehydrogenase PdxA [Neisseriaceae bacterium]|nr:4-hydroxythreonine-4-phosphate dehydrogenase PdxA [Neisseriaceae bacterium]